MKLAIRFISRTTGMLALLFLTFPGCKNQAKTTVQEVVDNQIYSFHKVLSLQNISFEIASSGQGSLQKLSIQPSGLSIDNRELIHQIDGQVVDAEIEDLNADGYPEILIYTQSTGSGSYGDLIAYSVNKGKSASQVYFPPLSENAEASVGYMGHDEFTVIETSLARRFPIYREGDTNAHPTGGMRQLQYKLVDGEASRRFIINRMTDFP